MSTSTTPPLTLRPLAAQNAPALQAAYDHAADYFQSATGGLPDPEQAAFDLGEAAADDGRYILGIYLQADLVGVVDLKLAEPEPFDVRLGLILLDEAHRRQGLGSLALRILEAWLSQATPTEAVVLTVPAQDHVAQSFFQHRGYTFTGQTLRAQTGNLRSRLLFMRKPLDTSFQD